MKDLHRNHLCQLTSIFIAISLFLFPSVCAAASAGPNSSDTMADDATAGVAPWFNPDNAKTSNDIYATCAVDVGDTSHYLKATNFGFSIPEGATINGILAEIEAKITYGSASQWTSVRIVKGGVISSTSKTGAAGAITGTEAYSSIPTSGASTDLWGESWTPADINSSSFGLVFRTTSSNRAYSVDHVRVTIYYTAVPTPSLKAHFGGGHINAGRF